MPLLECNLLETVDAVSEMVSLLDAGLFLLCSSTRASITSRLMSCQPCWILTFARASRSWSALVICKNEHQSTIHAVWCTYR